MNASSMWERVIAASDPLDREVYTEPHFAALYQRALSEAFAHGPAGYARDTLLAMRPWPFEPKDIKVPVDLWCGARDTSPVHSPTTARRLLPACPPRSDTSCSTQAACVPWGPRLSRPKGRRAPAGMRRARGIPETKAAVPRRRSRRPPAPGSLRRG